ncbi:hypothetical protein L3X38_010400 [Prunus dulcis]|uniref:Uncharacterized protein n=1 Tax=Prunus dulcis TaxID=3755 RepID=A0AAD4WFJ4_PRUDU|nr:hypothetical protein L3X38_010400 [Prunus dulcis]
MLFKNSSQLPSCMLAARDKEWCGCVDCVWEMMGMCLGNYENVKDEVVSGREQVDEITWMGKSTIIECLVRFSDAIENLYKKEYLRKPTAKDLQGLVQKGEARGFPGQDWKHQLHALTVEELHNFLVGRLWESKWLKKYNSGGRRFIQHLGLARLLRSCRITE